MQLKKHARLQENLGSDAEESSDGDRYEKEELPKARQARGTGISDDESEGVDSEQEKLSMDKQTLKMTMKTWSSMRLLLAFTIQTACLDIDEEESSSGVDI